MINSAVNTTRIPFEITFRKTYVSDSKLGIAKTLYIRRIHAPRRRKKISQFLRLLLTRLARSARSRLKLRQGPARVLVPRPIHRADSEFTFQRAEIASQSLTPVIPFPPSLKYLIKAEEKTGREGENDWWRLKRYAAPPPPLSPPSLKWWSAADKLNNARATAPEKRIYYSTR